MKEVKPLYSAPSYAPLVECSYLSSRRKKKELADISDLKQKTSFTWYSFKGLCNDKTSDYFETPFLINFHIIIFDGVFS